MQTRLAGEQRLAAVLMAVLLVLGACSSDEAGEVALATQCMRASSDNRAKLAASWLSNAEITIQEDLITVRTEVPVGVSIGGTVKIRYWTYRCRRNGKQMEFLGYETR